jgi:hypothetical protein
VGDVTAVAIDWIVGHDTGMSSKAVWAHMMGRDPADRFGVAYPHDPDDFGRCYRLLALIPEWRARIGEMARYGREWAALSARWAEVEASYEQEIGARHRGMARQTYALMREIIDAARQVTA